MKLFLSILLLSMASCCYGAHKSSVCPSLKQELNSFFLQDVNVYRRQIEGFNAPGPAVDSMMQVKECLDETVSIDKRYILNEILEKMVERCL